MNSLRITNEERQIIKSLYSIEEDIRPLQKLMYSKFTKDGKIIFYEGKYYSTETGNEILLNEDWSVSDILHAGGDVLSAGLDFIIPGSGAIVDVLNGLSYIIEAQFVDEDKKDNLYLMAAVTFAFVVLPGPLQAIAIPLKQFLKGSVKVASKGVLLALKTVGNIIDKVLLGIPSLINKALKTKLGGTILGKWGKNISKFFSDFSTRVKGVFSKIGGTPSAAQKINLNAAQKLATSTYKLTPKLLTKLNLSLQKLSTKVIGNKYAALKALGFKQGKMYRYLNNQGKINTVFIKEVKPDGTVIGLFGKQKGGTVLGTQAAVPAETFIGRAVAGPFGRRGATVAVPLFIKRAVDIMNDEGSLDLSKSPDDLNADEVSAASLAYVDEDVVANYQGDSGNYTVEKNVENIQNSLIALGYKLPQYGADGKFGPETLNAIKEFQKANGLPVDGKANQSFIKKLFEKLPQDNPISDEIKKLIK